MVLPIVPLTLEQSHTAEYPGLLAPQTQVSNVYFLPAHCAPKINNKSRKITAHDDIYIASILRIRMSICRAFGGHLMNSCGIVGLVYKIPLLLGPPEKGIGAQK